MTILESKVVVVTGAAQGFGQAISLACASAGAVIAAYDVSDCTETVELIHSAGGQAVALQLDIVNMAECIEATENLRKQFGRIDALVNNAALYGNLSWAPFDQIAEEEWTRCLTVNITGTWNMCKAVAPAMRAAKSGSIVNISSNTALLGPALTCHYVTSKAAVLGMTRVLATELGAYGVRVNALCPGGMDTPGTRRTLAGVDPAQILATLPPARLKGMLNPADVVGTIVFLVSDSSARMTGQTLAVDGGMASH